MWRLAYLPRADVVPVAHEMIVDNMNDGVMILDPQSRIVDLNPRAELIGHTLVEVMGKHVEESWPEWAELRKELELGPARMKELQLGIEKDEGTTFTIRLPIKRDAV
jgi:PAS domain S-box-containing protein